LKYTEAASVNVRRFKNRHSREGGNPTVIPVFAGMTAIEFSHTFG